MIGMLHFNPRSPCGERRISAMVMPSPPSISIHAPRAGSDRGYIIYDVFVEDFNPRSPCGERLSLFANRSRSLVFQSTLPVRGATYTMHSFGEYPRISIHAPRAGSDGHARYLFPCAAYFNPRSPCGERLICLGLPRSTRSFQSTLPVRGATNPV